MASWHRGIVSQVIAVNFGKAWLSGKKAVGQKPAFFHFMLFFFLRLIFSLELAGTLRCRRLSPRRKICNTPLWKRNHQNLLNLLNYSNTYSNHFLRFSACCIFMFTTPNHHPLPIHDPCTTIVTIITISALLSRSLFISFLWKHTNHVFDSRSNLVSSCFKSIFFLRCIEAPLTKILCRSFWPRSPGVAHRHFDAHATAAQTSQNPFTKRQDKPDWKNIRKIREDTTNVWILVMLYFT